MALGAPPALVAAANKDALDEIRHAELCFSLARALDGEEASPGAFPEAQRARTLPATRTLALAALAVDSLVDGALHEGVSARVIARLVKRCEEPQIRAVLKEIAADEGRHAAHGWDVVRWCLAEGGSPVADALRGASAALPRTMRTPLPAAAEDGGWERFGIHGRALEAEELTSTRADVVRRVEKMIGAEQAAAA
ncbi:MAG: ferritin-like domain-containing protein [Minicystis sp.]